MRKMARAIKAMLVIGAVVAAMLAGPASALIDHLPFGGSDRGGQENSALFGSDLSGTIERGDYKFDALAGHDLFGGYDRDGYEYVALAGHIAFGGYDRGGYEYS